MMMKMIMKMRILIRKIDIIKNITKEIITKINIIMKMKMKMTNMKIKIIKDK